MRILDTSTTAPDARGSSLPETRLTHLSLFSGIPEGGIDLAAHWAGFETVAFVERDLYCQKVLAKNFPGVPIYDDVTKFKALGYSPSAGLQTERHEETEPSRDAYKPNQNRISLLSGGFPCQPFSVAGKRQGTGDPRFLWHEMLRVIRETQPVWVLGENVRGLLSIDGGRTFGTIVHELAQVGYRVGWGVYGACHVGAPHRRERVFIVAHANDARDRASRCGTNGQRPAQDQGRQGQPQSEPCGHCGRFAQSGLGGVAHGISPRLDGTWEPEPNVGRVATGVPNRVDRLRALGNAVVPQQVYPILAEIADQLRRNP